MAEAILGLVGPGKGPKVFVSGLGQRLRARVTGLKDGVVKVFCGENQTHEITENGVHQIFVPEDHFVCVHYEGKSPSMICTFIGG